MSSARPRARARGALVAILLLLGVPGLLSAQTPSVPDTTWSALAGSRVTVFHAPRHAPLAARVLAFLEEQPPLPALDSGIPSGVEAYLAPDREGFAQLAGGVVPDWSGGVAIPSRRRIVVPVYAGQPGPAGERVRVLRHEWAHLGLNQQLGGLRAPRWFDEGYAQWASTWDRSEVWQLRLLLATDRAPPLDSLSLDWPRDAASARAAYLLAATAVEYLVQQSGERGLALLIARWRETGSFEEGLRGTYGVTQGQLEEHWRAYVRRRYGWLTVLTQSLVLWAGLAVLLMVLLGVRRRRDREKLARLRATEPADAPAYWRGEDGTEESSGGPGSV